MLCLSLFLGYDLMLTVKFLKSNAWIDLFYIGFFFEIQAVGQLLMVL